MKHLLALILLVVLLPVSAGADSSAEPAASGGAAPQPCCGGIHKKWKYERYLDGALQQSGFIVPAAGSVVYDVVPLKDGRILKAAVILFPLADGKPGIPWENGKTYYDGLIPGFGRIVAQQLDKGETWKFDFDGYTITDDEGFVYGDTIEADIWSSVPNGDTNWWHAKFSTGAWVAGNCSGSDDYLLGSTGKQYEELSAEQQQMGWTEVPLPKGVGHFYGRNHVKGEVWKVRINGQEYSATVQEADPTAMQLPPLKVQSPTKG